MHLLHRGIGHYTTNRQNPLTPADRVSLVLHSEVSPHSMPGASHLEDCLSPLPGKDWLHLNSLNVNPR